MMVILFAIQQANPTARISHATAMIITILYALEQLKYAMEKTMTAMD